MVSVLCLGLVELPASQSSCGWIAILVSGERRFALLQPEDVDCNPQKTHIDSGNEKTCNKINMRCRATVCLVHAATACKMDA